MTFNEQNLAQKAGLSNQELSNKIAKIRREDPSITQKAAVGKAIGILRPDKAKEIFKELHRPIQQTFLFTSESQSRKYAAKVHESRLGQVVSEDPKLITVESTGSRDLNELAQLANQMGSTGETQTEQESEAQKKLDTSRKEREGRQQETQRKNDQAAEKATSTRQQGVDRQRAGTDKAGENKKARTDRLQKQTDAKREADERGRDADQRRRDQVQRQKDREQERADDAEGDKDGEGDSDSLATTVATAAAKGVEAALSKSKDKKSDDKEKKEQMLSFSQYIEQAPTNSAGGDDIAGLGGDEPIVRGQAQRMKDCSKCKGAGCPACTPTAFIRRAGQVAEGVMRQLKAKRIADKVMEQSGTGGTGTGGGNGGAGNGGNGGTNGGNGNGNGNGKTNGNHRGRGFHGHGHGRTCPPGKVWDAAKQKCVNRTDEGVTPVRCSGCGKRFKSGAQFDQHDCPSCPKKLPGESAKDYTKRLVKLLQSKQGQNESRTGLQEASRADMQVNVFIKSIKDKGKKKFAQAFLKSFGRKMPPPSKFGISDDDAARLRSSIDRIQNDFAEAVENLDMPAATAADIPADAEPTTKTYAGSPVFKVSPETFARCSGGRKKWARWSKTLNLEDEGQAAIRTYANKYPSRPIVLQCDETGDMKFLRFNRKGGGGNRKRRKTALPTPTDGSTGQIVFDADNEQVNEAQQKRITASLAAGILRDRGHKLKANEIFRIAEKHNVGRHLKSPALGLVFTRDEVDKLDKILSKR